VALTSHLMKIVERLVLVHLRLLVSSSLDPLQFSYQSGIGVDDAFIFSPGKGLISAEDDREYRGFNQDFIGWCQRNRLQIN